MIHRLISGLKSILKIYSPVLHSPFYTPSESIFSFSLVCILFLNIAYVIYDDVKDLSCMWVYTRVQSVPCHALALRESATSMSCSCLKGVTCETNGFVPSCQGEKPKIANANYVTKEFLTATSTTKS